MAAPAPSDGVSDKEARVREGLEEVARHLESRHEEIIDLWMRLCDADPALAVASKLTRSEFRDHIPAAIESFCRILRHPEERWSKEAQEEMGKHGHHRWEQGFSLEELIHDWGHLNHVLVSVIMGFFLARDSTEVCKCEPEAVDRLASFMTEAISCSVRRFDELRRAEAAAVAGDLRVAKEQFEAVTQSRGQMLREAAHDIRGGRPVGAESLGHRPRYSRLCRFAPRSRTERPRAASTARAVRSLPR